METSRREFVRGAALLAAGAGIGLPLLGSAPKRIMTEVKMILFSKDPIAIKAAVYSNEASDVFGIDMALVKVRMPLSAVRSVLDGRITRFDAVLEASRETERVRARAYLDGDRFCIANDRSDGSPCWLSVDDVRKAV